MPPVPSGSTMRPATHAPATSTLHTHAVAAANAQSDARARGKVERLERLQTGARHRHAALEGEHTERGYKTPAQNLYDRRVALPCKSRQWLVSSCTHSTNCARAHCAGGRSARRRWGRTDQGPFELVSSARPCPHRCHRLATRGAVVDLFCTSSTASSSSRSSRVLPTPCTRVQGLDT